MPDRLSRSVAGEATAGTAGRRLLSSRLQRPTCACAVDVAEQAAVVFLVVRGQCRRAARRRCRSQASRRTAWLPVRSAHLGTDTHSTSAHPLRGAWWRARPRPLALDRFPFQLPAAGQGAQPRLPRQVRRRTAAPLCPPSVALLRRVQAAPRREALRRLPARTLSPRLGRLCQATLRRSRACAALPGPLYPLRRHLQPSPALGLSF